jgi:formate-dependent nitrite reductase membrane component NrfD
MAQIGNESVNSLATFVTWFTVFVISLITPPLLENLGVAITFLIYGCCAFVGFIYFLTFMKPTEGLNKQELKILFFSEEYKKSFVILNATRNTEIERE